MALATPNDFESWEYQGISLAAAGKYQEAITSFNQALNLNPNYSEAFYHKALCYSLLGNIDQAIEDLQQAIYLKPEKWINNAKNESNFDKIRDDWRFQALMDGEIRTTRHNISWEEFENILAEMGDNRTTRVTYDRGVLEIVMPSQNHEYFKESFGDFIKYLLDELDIDYLPLGSSIWKRKDFQKGTEPEHCFYIKNVDLVRDKVPNIDISQDPPPDLVLEIDYTSPSIKKFPIYASFGVPEIWVYDIKKDDRKKLYIYQLENGDYKEKSESSFFSGFAVQQIQEFVEKNMNKTRREIKKALREWVDKV